MPLIYESGVEPKPGDIIFYDTKEDLSLGLWNKIIKCAQGSTVTHVGILYAVIPAQTLQQKESSVLSASWQSNSSVAILIDAISGGINIGPIGNYRGRVYRWQGQGGDDIAKRIASYAYSCGYNPKTWDQFSWGKPEQHLYQGNGGSYTVLQPVQVPIRKGFANFDMDVFQGKQAKYYLRHLPGWGQTGFYKNSWYCSKFVTQTLQIAIRSYYDDTLQCLLNWLLLYLQEVDFCLIDADRLAVESLFSHLLGDVWKSQQGTLKEKIKQLPAKDHGYLLYIKQMLSKQDMGNIKKRRQLSQKRLQKLDTKNSFASNSCIFSAVSLYHKLLLLSHYFDLNTKFIGVADLLAILEEQVAFKFLGFWRNKDNQDSEIWCGLKCYRDGNWLAARYLSKRQTNYAKQVLVNKSFDGQNLQGADFSYARLINVSFKQANLQGANFIQARLKNVDCTQADLKETILNHLHPEELNCCVGEPEQTLINLLLVGAQIRTYFEPTQKHTSLFELISFLEAERAKKLSSEDWFVQCCQWLAIQKGILLFPKKKVIKRYLLFTGLYMGLDHIRVQSLVNQQFDHIARDDEIPADRVKGDSSLRTKRRESECSFFSLSP